MPETIKAWLDDQIGITGQYLWLRKTDGSLLNTGGDALAESPAGSGQFAATLTESRTGLGTLRAVITGSSDPADAVMAGWLAESATLVSEELPVSSGGGSGDAEQATLLAVEDKIDALSVALAGSSPVEPTGDSETVMARLARIESAVLLANTTIATLASQTSFTLVAGSTDNDAYFNQTAVITNSATATQKAVATIIDYDGSTKTVTLKAPPAFTIAAGDSIAIIAGSSGGSQSVTLQLGATIPLTLGQVTGLTQDLVVGNSYTQELGTRIPVTLTDTSGNAVDTTFGDRSLSDANCTIKCVLHPMNARNTDNVTAAAQGDCEFVPASGSDPASLWIELPKAQTDKLSPGMYSIQFHAIWDDGETVTIAWKGQCRFVRIIRPKN